MHRSLSQLSACLMGLVSAFLCVNDAAAQQRPVTPVIAADGQTLSADSVFHYYNGSASITISSPDDTPIFYTLDGSMPTRSSQPFTAAFLITGEKTVTAVCLPSDSTRLGSLPAMIIFKVFLPCDSAPGAVAGLDYAWYQGAWSSLPDFATLTPAKTGAVPNFALPSGTGNTNFAIRWEGYLKAPTDGNYTFYLSSDDGGKLSIASIVVVDNDGMHDGSVESAGRIGLRAGLHAVSGAWFAGSPSAISLAWDGPGFARQPLPDAVLWRPDSTMAHAPVIVPPGGSYVDSQIVSLYSLTPGVTIRYRVDNADSALDNGTVYAGPFVIRQTTTVRARAFRSGLTPSNISTAAFTIMQAPVRLTSPLTGETCHVGDTLHIRWVSSLTWFNEAVLLFSPNAGRTYDLINVEGAVHLGTPGWGDYAWVIPGQWNGASIISDQCIIIVKQYNGPTVTQSAGSFSIAPALRTVRRSAPPQKAGKLLCNRRLTIDVAEGEDHVTELISISGRTVAVMKGSGPQSIQLGRSVHAGCYCIRASAGGRTLVTRTLVGAGR